MVDNCKRKDYYLETDFSGSTDKCIESPLPVALDVIGDFYMALNPTVFYRDSVIETAFIMDSEKQELKSLALRYIEPGDVLDKDGKYLDSLTNIMGGATDWFILPDTLGLAVAKKLFELYSSGLDGFVEDQIAGLKNWLIENGELADCMCY